MFMTFQRSLWLMATIILSLSAAVPALAYKWRGDPPPEGGAIAAKVIGKHCSGVLTASEIDEIEAYLVEVARDNANERPDDNGFSEIFARRFTASMEKKYSDHAACNADAAEAAQDVLQKIRKWNARTTPENTGKSGTDGKQ
jgi:hypothetical protein